jgi:diketogulonate reductase-like aldo/keto reductase
MVNQIRLCPGETQSAVVESCKSHRILPEAYSPLGTGRIFNAPEMKALADKYQRVNVTWCNIYSSTNSLKFSATLYITYGS